MSAQLHIRFGSPTESGVYLRRVTPKFVQFLGLVAMGTENKEIAKIMHIEVRTVKMYAKRAFTMFGIEDGIKRVKLATFIYRRLQENPHFLETLK